MGNTLGMQLGTAGVNAAANAANGAIGMLLGRVMEGHNDRRQISQQQKLTNMQTDANKQLAQFDYENQMKMWHETNYAAQREEMEKAGINPALMYGMGGSGGATTNAAQSGRVNTGEAPKGGGEQMGMALQMMNMQTQQAQLELIKAQTRKTEAEANKTSGVDTEEAQTRIKSLTQGITNQQAVEALTKVETQLKELDKTYAGATLADRLDQVEYQTQRALTELQNAQNTTYINKATRDSQIQIVRQTAIGAVLRNTLTVAETENVRQKTAESKQAIEESKSRIAVNDQQIATMAAAIDQKWSELQNQAEQTGQGLTRIMLDKLKVDLEMRMQDWQMNNPEIWKQIGGGLKKGSDKIDAAVEAINNILAKMRAPLKP